MEEEKTFSVLRFSFREIEKYIKGMKTDNRKRFPCSVFRFAYSVRFVLRKTKTENGNRKRKTEKPKRFRLPIFVYLFPYAWKRKMQNGKSKRKAENGKRKNIFRFAFLEKRVKWRTENETFPFCFPLRFPENETGKGKWKSWNIFVFHRFSFFFRFPGNEKRRTYVFHFPFFPRNFLCFRFPFFDFSFFSPETESVVFFSVSCLPVSEKNGKQKPENVSRFRFPRRFPENESDKGNGKQNVFVLRFSFFCLPFCWKRNIQNGKSKRKPENGKRITFRVLRFAFRERKKMINGKRHRIAFLHPQPNLVSKGAMGV